MQAVLSFTPGVVVAAVAHWWIRLRNVAQAPGVVSLPTLVEHPIGVRTDFVADLSHELGRLAGAMRVLATNLQREHTPAVTGEGGPIFIPRVPVRTISPTVAVPMTADRGYASRIAGPGFPLELAAHGPTASSQRTALTTPTRPATPP